MDRNDKIPTYKVDISSSRCWNSIVKDYKPQIMTVLSKMRPLYASYLTAFTIGLHAYKLFDGPIYYEDEIAEIAAILKISFAECLLFQLTYELCSACTSAIMLCDGTYVHARTMDWALPELKAITIRITMVSGATELCEAVTWAGFVGIFTGIKPNHYTVALNYRRSGSPNFTNNIMAVFKGYYPSAFFIRELLTSESVSSRNNRIADGDPRRIADTYMIAPSYISVLTNDPATSGVYICNRENSVFKPAPCVQTNSDGIKNSAGYIGPNIMYSFERLDYMMEIIDKNPTVEELTSYMQVFPVENEDTIYSLIMTPTGIVHIW
jgi:hypothetical protein